MFVLIMVLLTYGHGGVDTIQQEFSNYASCEEARKWVVASSQNNDFRVVSQGCFKK